MSPMPTRREQADYQLRWMGARRTAWILKHGPCVDCGSTTDLQVDHIDPTRKVSHRVWSWSAKRRAIELARCQVLCRPCHIEKTLADNGMSRSPHGTRNRYSHYGCRCRPCTDANAAHERARRERRRAELARAS